MKYKLELVRIKDVISIETDSIQTLFSSMDFLDLPNNPVEYWTVYDEEGKIIAHDKKNIYIK